MSYLIQTGRYAGMIAKSNNRSGVAGAFIGPGVVICTAVLDWIHQVPIGRSFYVAKIMWFNPGVLATLNFGTLSNAAAFVPMFPTQNALPGVPGDLLEEELVGVEFMLNSQAAPAGWDGNLYVVSSLAGILITAEVAEKT